ncbi:hypothetical protein BGZ58_004053 [Dissophora ornata]|nr:hypothetical protein BGZ58_004053 [Dissophora ornata]
MPLLQPGSGPVLTSSTTNSPSGFIIDGVNSVLTLEDTLTTPYLTEESRATLTEVRQLNDSYLNAIKFGQVTQATDIKNTMARLFETVLSELDKGSSFQDKLLKMQELMLEKQQQALEAHAVTQKNIQAIFTQAYELHEYDIPRLFIVLPPMATGKKGGKITKPFSHQFRLFFLCECGIHTMPKEGGLQHHIHIAAHEGYALEKPTEFFEKYGSYLLTMMQMIKYGVSAAGVIVPSAVSGPLNPLVDESIAYLKSQKELTEASNDFSIYGQSDRHIAFEGADLRKLRTYLKITDKDDALGNLFRMVTPEGNVKWVCSKHYRQGYREEGTAAVKDVVRINRGRYEQVGDGGVKVEIKLDSPIQAQQFYSALTRADAVGELNITLSWDVTVSDLKAFVLALSKTPISKLTVNGGSFKNPTLDLVNSNRRFDPLMQLLFNDRIRSLHFNGFDDFFHRVGNPPPSMATKLQYLSFDTGPITKRKNAQEILALILKYAPSLTELRLSCQALFESTLKQASKGTPLRKLIWEGKSFSAHVLLEQGSMSASLLRAERLEDLTPDGQKFALNGQLNGLIIRKTPRKVDDALLRQIVQKNLSLSSVAINSHYSRAVPVLDLLLSSRDELFSANKICTLTYISVVDLTPTQDKAVHVTIINYASTTTAERSIDARLITLHEPNIDPDFIAAYLQEYGAYMKGIIVSKDFENRHAEILRNVHSPKLETLDLQPALLGDTALDALGHFIDDGCPALNELDFTVETMEKDRQREVAVRVLNRHSQKVTAASLIGHISFPWLSQLSKALPPRSEFHNLNSLSIGLVVISDEDVVQWLVSMVSTRLLTPPIFGTVAGSGTSFHRQRHITSFTLARCRLKAQDWAILISALDFTVLENVGLLDESFGMEQFRHLVEHLPNSVMAPVASHDPVA